MSGSTGLSRSECAATLGAAAVLSALAFAQPAAAQSASQLQAIQGQIATLQEQLRRLQQQAAQRDEAVKRAEASAETAREEARRAIQAEVVGGSSSGLVVTQPEDKDLALKTPCAPAPGINPNLRLGGVTVSLCGFMDLTGIARSRNLTAGASTPFNAIPFKNNPNAHTGEFRETAQQSRLSILLQGTVAPNVNVGAYFEGDLNGAATTANSYQSNGYTPRVRQAYAQYEDGNLGIHVLVGQAWTLATPSQVGIVPRKEALPPVIDANFFPGFVYTRSPQVRVVKDFGPAFSVGISAETPQAVYAFNPTVSSFTNAMTGAGSLASSALPGVGRLSSAGVLTYNNPGSGFLNTTTNYSVDVAPDLIVKAAVDSGFGHYEAYGLGRWFKTRLSTGNGTTIGAGQDKIAFGGGVGGAADIQVIPKKLELQGDILAGYGVGRYGSGLLPDATFKGDGSPSPLPELIAMAGVVGHPIKPVDLYTYVGWEQLGRSRYNTISGGKTTENGYGQATINLAGCDIELASSCNAQTRAMFDVTAGGWWRFLHGNYGTVQAGVQYSYTKRIAFHGAANASGSIGTKPSVDDSTVFFTLRYLPFQ